MAGPLLSILSALQSPLVLWVRLYKLRGAPGVRPLQDCKLIGWRSLIRLRYLIYGV